MIMWKVFFRSIVRKVVGRRRWLVKIAFALPAVALLLGMTVPANYISAEVESQDVQPPMVSTLDATNIAATTATLNGNLQRLGGASSVQVSFQWGNATPGDVLDTYPVGDVPNALAFDGTNMWVSNYNNDNIMKLRDSDGVVLGTYSVGGMPSALAFDGDNMWVSNHSDDNMMKLRASPYEIETSPETMDTTGPFSAPLSGLDLGTTYHFRAKAVGDGTAYGGDMTFETYICGDVNNDGNVNMADVMILWYDIAEYPSTGAWTISNERAADVNCDEVINMADVMILWYDIADYPSAGAWEIACCE